MALVLYIVVHQHALLEHLNGPESNTSKFCRGKRHFYNCSFKEGIIWMNHNTCACEGWEMGKGRMINYLKLTITVGYLLHSPPSLIPLPTISVNQYIKADIQLLQIHLEYCTCDFYQALITSLKKAFSAFLQSCKLEHPMKNLSFLT